MYSALIQSFSEKSTCSARAFDKQQICLDVSMDLDPAMNVSLPCSFATSDRPFLLECDSDDSSDL